MKIVGIDASLTSTGIYILEAIPPRTRAIQSKAFGVRQQEVIEEMQGKRGTKKKAG